MSAIGSTVAIVSLGMSCQSAHQINTQIPLLSRLVGEPLEQRRLPFDWLICPVQSTVDCLRDWKFFPSSPEELTDRHRPYWQKRNIYYWHDENVTTRVWNVRQKYEHSARTLAKVREMRRRIFILSNSQNSLSRVSAATGTIQVKIDIEEIREAERAVNEIFGNSEVYTVTYDNRLELRGSPAHDRIFKIPPDQTRWKGSEADWAAVFQQIFHG
jgi:hypothetical protein